MIRDKSMRRLSNATKVLIGVATATSLIAVGSLAALAYLVGKI